MMRFSRSFVLMLLGTCGLGCADAPPPAESPASPDEQVLQVLDPYNPLYKLDSDGRVVRLKLEGRHVLPGVLTEVGRLTELRSLSLYAASVNDESLAQLTGLEKLQNLGLGATAITDEGLVHLEKIAELRQVWLTKANLSTEAIEKLRAAVPGINVHFQ